MREEFNKLANIGWDDISDKDYADIEYVYANHPAISDKKDIVNIWKLPNGMLIIRDMIPTALKANEIDSKIIRYQNMVNRAKKMKEALKAGNYTMLKMLEEDEANYEKTSRD